MRGSVMVGCLLASCVGSPRLAGPLPVRNQHPAQLTVMHMDPADASVLAAGRSHWRTGVAYSSLFLAGSDGGASWVMDGESMRGVLDGRVGLGGGVQLGVQLAAGHTSGGFLDDFIIDYHSLFGFPDQGRSTTARNGYAVEARRDGETVFAVAESTAEWMDVPIQLTWQLREPGEGRVGLAVRGGVELPVGDQDRGFGNGQLDTSFGAVADYRTAGIGIYAHAQHTFAGTPRRYRNGGLSFGDVTSFGVGVELPLGEQLSALVQTEWESSALRDLGTAETGRDQALLWLGGRWQIDREWSLAFGLAEDLIGYASPDFTVWCGMTWQPGAAAP